jgi:hypothetical protein
VSWPCGQNFSSQARKPPTALLAPRGVRLGLPVLTAGPVHYLFGRYATGPVAAALVDRALGGSHTLFLRATLNRGAEA